MDAVRGASPEDEPVTLAEPPRPIKRFRTIASRIRIGLLFLAGTTWACHGPAGSSLDDTSSGTTGSGGTSGPGETPCGDEQTLCNGECVDLDSSMGHCGGCGEVCTGDRCLAGICGERCDKAGEPCGDGGKCTLLGAMTFDERRCRPILGTQGPGDVCQQLVQKGLGVDDCGQGSLCWTGGDFPDGYCMAFCDERGALCAPGGVCSLAFTQFGFADELLCATMCDPVLADCSLESERCVPSIDGVVCRAAGPSAAAYGEPCSWPTECDVGLACAPAQEGCSSEYGCCTAACYVEGSECPEADQGQSCASLDSPLPGQDNYGICRFP